MHKPTRELCGSVRRSQGRAIRLRGRAAARHAPAPPVFGRDAQAGTQLARENPHEGNTRRLRAEQQMDVLRIVQRHPVVKGSDFVVPGTLRV